MKIGTKSVLFGVHCWFIHPWFVALAWWNLYGFPWDPRLWVAFFVHDLGYWGKPNMDGPEGERHVEFGARLMGQLFDPANYFFGFKTIHHRKGYWYELTLYHSRFYAKRDGRAYSRLCVADKLATILTPAWLYLPLANLSGEIHEYIAKAKEGKYQKQNLAVEDQLQWYRSIQAYLSEWVATHKDGRLDTWTDLNEGED